MRKYFVFLMLMIVGILSAKASGPSGTLPVLYVNIENGQEVVTKEPYLNAVYWLDPMGQAGIDAVGSQDQPLVTKIKGRGNYTFIGFDKKPYRLKLDKKAKLCGMKSSKHFGLLAHADDNRGFLRNTLGFKASEIVGLPWTPAQYPVELVINGTYRGLYFLTELIRIDTDRVNITKWGEEDEAGNALDKWIEGGTLVELDNYEEEAQIQFNNPGAPEPLRFTYDKSVDPGFEPDGYIDWLRSSLGRVNDMILHGDRNSDELWNYVDIDDLARFIAVQEFMDNYESFHGSCYLFREKGDNEKWHFSPVWDFGSAFQRQHPNHPFYEQADGNMHYNHWISELMQFPALKSKVAEYWAILKNKRGEIDSYAEAFIAQITSAAAADKQRWPQYGNDNLNGKLNEVKGYMNYSTSFMNDYYGSGGDDSKSFYLVGEFNSWGLSDENYKFTFQDGEYVYNVTSAIAGQWKINDGSWAESFGSNGSQVDYNNDYNLGQTDANLTIGLPVGAKLIFKYNQGGTSTLRIVYNQGGDDNNDKKFYLVGQFNGWTLKDSGYELKSTADGYTYEVSSYIASGWKINDGTWDLNFGAQKNGPQPEANKTYGLAPDGDNISLALNPGTKITFKYVENGTSTLLIKTEGGDEPTVDKDFYLVGGFNGWTLKDANYKFKKRGNVYIYECTEAISSEWKINDGAWNSVDLGKNESNPEYNHVYNLRFGGGNINTSIPAGAKILFIFNETGTSTLTIQTEPEQNDHLKTIRFIDTHTSDPWDQVFVWIYNGDNTNEDFTGGQKPGAAMTREETSESQMQRAPGNATWVHSFNPGREVQNLKVVFSNGETGNETDETDYKPVISRDTVTGLINIEASEGYTVGVKDGMLIVESHIDFNLPISDLTGICKTFHITPGTTVINLGKGLYIINNKKVML